MPNNRKLPDGIIRLDKLTPGDIKNKDVTCINITVLPEEDGKLEIEGSWKELIKVLLWRLYMTRSKGFMRILYDAEIVDRDFQIYNEQVGIARDSGIVYAEKIPGIPYYIDYDYSDKTLYIKVRYLSEAMDFKPKDILLTLKPRTGVV